MPADFAENVREFRVRSSKHFWHRRSPDMRKINNSGLQNLQRDPDIRNEARLSAIEGDKASPKQPFRQASSAAPSAVVGRVPLTVLNQSHRASPGSRKLVEQVGGLARVQQFTAAFYDKAFQDPVLDPFIREHGGHHGERFANWIVEKMGAGTVWTDERRTRPRCPFTAHGETFHSAHDRSSAHFAAWHSPKRPVEKWGDHFKLNEARVWMRLHFWSMREVGIVDQCPAFADYYSRLIGHFVSVYERTAPPFTRESLRWSADPKNIEHYLSNGRTMPDVHVPYAEAIKCLPEHEREYHGSSSNKKFWPYD